MRFVTYDPTGTGARLGLLDGERILDLAAVAGAHGSDAGAFTSMLALIAAGQHAQEAAETLRSFARGRDAAGWWTPLADARLRPPVPTPPKIICLAGNYADHIREGGLTASPKETTTPLLFSKPVTTLIGHNDPIHLPGPLCTAVDYEGELVAVIG